jgi:hypothetical protein
LAQSVWRREQFGAEQFGAKSNLAQSNLAQSCFLAQSVIATGPDQNRSDHEKNYLDQDQENTSKYFKSSTVSGKFAAKNQGKIGKLYIGHI